MCGIAGLFPSLRLGFIVLIWLGISSEGQAQDRKSDLKKMARAVLETGCSATWREANARAFVASAQPEDWSLAFEVVREVVDRRDEIERKLVEARRPVTHQWDPDDDGMLGFFSELWHKEEIQKNEVKRFEAELGAEEAVLDVFRSSLTAVAARSDPEVFIDFVARQAAVRKRTELAKALRALGFFPTPASRRLMLDRLADTDTVVGLAAARACDEHVRAFSTPTTSEPLWPEAFERIQAALHRAWRNRDVHYRRYRVLAKKSAAIKGKVFISVTRYMKSLGDLLWEAMSALSDLKNAKERIRKAADSAKTPKPLRSTFEKALDRHREARRELRVRDLRIKTLVTVAGWVFDRMNAEQRVPFEAHLVKCLENTRPQTDSLRLVELCGYLRSETIRNALVGASSGPSAGARVAVCRALEKHPGPAHVLALKTRLEDSHWQVKVAAVHALCAAGGRDAVDVLVSAVGNTQSRVRNEVDRALHLMTGMEFHQDALRWKEWWDRNREHYHGPAPKPKDSPRKERPAAERTGIECFGIQTHSRRITFIIDGSVAMNLVMGKTAILGPQPGIKVDPNELKMSYARKAMADALAALPSDSAFNILVYGNKVKAWKHDLVPANASNKKAARDWLARVKPKGCAAIFDAIVRAFDPAGREASAHLRSKAADTFFIVAGGPASGGDIAVEADIVEEIERLNRLKQVNIHTVSVAKNGPTGLLRALASRCGGRYTVLRERSSRK